MRLGIKIDARNLARFESAERGVIMQCHKGVGNALDQIFEAMEEQGLEIPDELMELKQWLRFKGNSQREKGNLEMWEFV